MSKFGGDRETYGMLLRMLAMYVPTLLGSYCLSSVSMLLRLASSSSLHQLWLGLKGVRLKDWRLVARWKECLKRV